MIISKQTHHGIAIYVAEAAIYERHLAKAAGFKWDGKAGHWWTKNKVNAAMLRNYSDETCKAELADIPVRVQKWFKKAVAQVDATKKRREYRLLRLPSGSVIAIGIDAMIAEDGTEIPPSNVAGLYKLAGGIPMEADLQSLLKSQATLVAQCPANDWQTAVRALTAEDNTPDAI